MDIIRGCRADLFLNSDIVTRNPEQIEKIVYSFENAEESGTVMFDTRIDTGGEMCGISAYR
jgi:hypothetical protein